MACTGHNATTPNGVACPAYVGPGSGYSFTTADLNGQTIQEYNFNQLRTAINSELARRGTNWAAVLSQYGYNDPGTRVAGDQIGYDNWRALRFAIEHCRNFTNVYTTNEYIVQGAVIIDDTVEELRAGINAANAQCLCVCNYACTCDCNYCTCDCNYCTCDCNYCTCNCNYCTCNCNYCTCACNYACTCNCNYSDIRLKKDIEEI